MKDKTDPPRNRPSSDGEKNDPNLRDRSDAQPGASTVSSSSSDKDNEQITETNRGNFGESMEDEFADDDYETGGGD
jgi:hypothetical protein